MFKLFAVDTSGLALRFFKYLAIVLASRLAHLTTGMSRSLTRYPSFFPLKQSFSQPLSQTVIRKSRSDTNQVSACQHGPFNYEELLPVASSGHRNTVCVVDPHEVTYLRGDITADFYDEEVVLKECKCTFKRGTLNHTGILTITKQRILLTAKIFNYKLKEEIFFNTITSIHHRAGKYIHVRYTAKGESHLSVIRTSKSKEMYVVMDGIWKGTPGVVSTTELLPLCQSCSKTKEILKL